MTVIFLLSLVGNSPDKLRHTRSVAYSVELVMLNKRQVSDGGAYLDCYHMHYRFEQYNKEICGMKSHFHMVTVLVSWDQLS